MLASWPDDGPDARKYELSCGRSRSERLSDSLQGLHDPGEPSSYDCAKKLTAESYNHRIVTERSGDERSRRRCRTMKAQLGRSGLVGAR